MADGEVRTDTIDSLELPEPGPPGDAAWLAAANALAPAVRGAQWGGGWRLNASARLRLVHGAEERTVQLARAADASLVARRDADDAFVDVAGQSLEFRVAPAPTVEEAVRHAAGAAGSHAALSAPMPGRVLAVRVREGSSVQAHETVVVVEAMKMEHAVVSPLAGTVTRLHVSEGQQVARGELLAEVSA
jgi:biotin carboxyl carrier protein